MRVNGSTADGNVRTRVLAKRLRRLPTKAETMLWRDLRDRRSFDHKFRRQVSVASYVVDFICFEARLIVELDGPLHADPVQRAHDLGRDTWLRGQGFHILRFSNDLILGGSGQLVLDAILAALPGPAAPSSDPASPCRRLPRGEKGRAAPASHA